MRQLDSIQRVMWVVCLFAAIAFEADYAAGGNSTCRRCKSSPPSASAARDESPALRQCRGVYFNAEYNAWFTVDCLVRAEESQVGLFVNALIPEVGYKHLWVTEPYAQPRVNPPFSAQPTAAAKSQGKTAVIALNLPPDIQLKVNDQAVAVVPGKQEVVIRGLNDGPVYKYSFHAEFERGGKPVHEERLISFRAGDHVVVDFVTHAQQDSISFNR